MNDVSPASAVQTSLPRGRTWLALLLGAGVSVFAVWLIARTVNVNETIAALTAAHLGWFVLAFCVQMISALFSLRRWQILLSPYPTRFFPLAQIYFSAHLLNTLLPAKLGTVARVLLAAESEKLNSGFVLGSVAIEKVLDTLFMLILLAALAPFVPLDAWLRDSILLSVGLALCAAIVLLLFRGVREPLLELAARVEARLVGNHSQPVSTFLRGIFESLLNLTRRREAMRVLFWTIFVWLVGALVNQLLFFALNLHVPWSAAWFVVISLQIGTRVPALPASLGVFHSIVIYALMLYGVDPSIALAYAILLHLVVFILPAFVGAACALPVSARLVALVTNGERST